MWNGIEFNCRQEHSCLLIIFLMFDQFSIILHISSLTRYRHTLKLSAGTIISYTQYCSLKASYHSFLTTGENHTVMVKKNKGVPCNMCAVFLSRSTHLWVMERKMETYRWTYRPANTVYYFSTGKHFVMQFISVITKTNWPVYLWCTF